MTALLTLREAGAILRVKDGRTTKRRLAELGCPVIPVGRSVLVRVADLERAIAAAAVRSAGGDSRPAPAGVVLEAGARLWDAPSALRQRRA